MGFSMNELLILMVIGVIIFGPEDLPDIARTVGKFVYEIKKMFNEATKDIKDATKDFKDVIDAPSNVINKTYEDTIKPVLDLDNTSSKKTTHEEKVGKEAEEKLLTYDEVEKTASNPQVEERDKDLDPLAELPTDMVSYNIENKGASR
ncbi:MAG TPA: twin-arginine translocase TatA/TatE family subunit [Clostridia bacterium]|nr:twin-arginine translocase TatA/TatE family subunit [Clostridia bacterium]